MESKWNLILVKLEEFKKLFNLTTDESETNSRLFEAEKQVSRPYNIRDHNIKTLYEHMNNFVIFKNILQGMTKNSHV